MDGFRVGIASFGVEEFSLLHSVCEEHGFTPVVYLYSRSMRPSAPVEDWAVRSLAGIMPALPSGMDLLLPGDTRELAGVLAGYRLDALVVYGFNWRIPADVRGVLRFGALNVHTSLLPRHRGPAPIIAAIRQGESAIGVTVLRMDDGFDTGPVLAQVGDVPLEENATWEGTRVALRPAVRTTLAAALTRVLRGEEGEPQREADASYAGFLEPSFGRIDWSWTAARIHHQVRVFRYLGRDDAPVGLIEGLEQVARRSRLTPGEGVRVECADGPIWIVESEPTDSAPQF